MKLNVHSLLENANELRARLLNDGGTEDASSILKQVSDIQAFVRQYREDYEDVLSVTSTWAPDRRDDAPSDAGSRRSNFSTRTTQSELDRREYQRLQMELASEKATVEIEQQTRIELQQQN